MKREYKPSAQAFDHRRGTASQILMINLGITKPADLWIINYIFNRMPSRSGTDNAVMVEMGLEYSE